MGGDATNLLIVELTLRISAIKSLMVKKGIFTESEFDAEIDEIQLKIKDMFTGSESLTSEFPTKNKPPSN